MRGENRTCYLEEEADPWCRGGEEKECGRKEEPMVMQVLVDASFFTPGLHRG
jgi:hypothetical protein